MFKASRIAAAAVFIATASGTLVFQNCAPGKLSNLSSESVNIASTTDVTVPDDHPTTVDPATNSTTYDTLIVDRYYVNALFADVFGPSSQSVDSFRSYSNTIDMGTPCSTFETYYATTQIKKVFDANGNPVLDENGNQKENFSGTIDDKMQQSCGMTSAARLTAQINPKATVTREAKLARSCSDLVTNQTTLVYALSQIDLSGDIPAATDANVLTAYQLFYRLQPDPDQGLIDSLKLMMPVAPATPAYDDWRAVLYTICISPQWQVM